MKPALFPAILILLLPAALAGCQPSGSPKAEDAPSQAGDEASASLKAGFDYASAGQQAPDMALETNADGTTETLADIQRANPGKKLLVNLWATWCVPCLKELPTLDALAADTEGQLLVVPISQDMEGWRKVTDAFTAEKYPHLQTRVESKMQFGFSLGVKGLPVTILYDADGKEVWRYLGDRDWNSAESREKIGV